MWYKSFPNPIPKPNNTLTDLFTPLKSPIKRTTAQIQFEHKQKHKCHLNFLCFVLIKASLVASRNCSGVPLVIDLQRRIFIQWIKCLCEQNPVSIGLINHFKALLAHTATTIWREYYDCERASERAPRAQRMNVSILISGVWCIYDDVQLMSVYEYSKWCSLNPTTMLAAAIVRGSK